MKRTRQQAPWVGALCIGALLATGCSATTPNASSTAPMVTTPAAAPGSPETGSTEAGGTTGAPTTPPGDTPASGPADPEPTKSIEVIGTATATPSSTAEAQPRVSGPLEERAATAAKELTAIVTELLAQAQDSAIGDELPAATDLFDWQDRLTTSGLTLSFFDSPLGSTQFPGLTYSYYQLDEGARTACILRIGDADPSLLPLEPGVYNANQATYIALPGACAQYGANPVDLNNN